MLENPERCPPRSRNAFAGKHQRFAPKGAYKTGGSGTWLTGSYDVATNTILWGVGNPGPWLATMRPGDNLYSDSLIAPNPATGKIKWHYQYTPNDTSDCDGVNEPVLTSLNYQGKTYKAVVSASRNGWFYAINRERRSSAT
ncbi:hypothetical protein [Lichenicoccus sp.]|uniref:hypothetical protein n=1 Tax=Lichenicoccus sp. TaxID=2781899 RepID=UPI003D0BF2B1